LPSNLRLTTRECVHLVTRGHFRSRDKDGSHTIQSTVDKNPALSTACKYQGSMFIEPEFIIIIIIIITDIFRVA